MITIEIIGAAVVLLAVIASLATPFLRSLRFPEDTAEEGAAPADKLPAISIVITAHDSLPELQRNLNPFLEQDYPAPYQVIVVCQSTDAETIDFLKRMASDHPSLYYTFIPESSRYMSRKKLQITLGVKAAKHEWIILTEPTCHPESTSWLSAMARQCCASNDLVLGYVALDEETKTVRRFENIRKACYLLHRAQRSYGYRTNMPCVAFRKQMFMEGQGYQGNLELVRGEYDLLVNKYAQPGNTAVELSPEARLVNDEPTDKEWHNAHLYLQASRKSLSRSGSMRLLMFFDHLLPHLSLLAIVGAMTYGILAQVWLLCAAAGVAFLLLFVLRMMIASRFIKHFDTSIPTLSLPFLEYGIVWRNLAVKLRYWHADKNDFTSHKL